jgi:hypothetical protein
MQQTRTKSLKSGWNSVVLGPEEDLQERSILKILGWKVAQTIPFSKPVRLMPDSGLTKQKKMIPKREHGYALSEESAPFLREHPELRQIPS